MKTPIRDRRFFLWPAATGAFFGLLAFARVSSKPRFASIHVLDVIGLMTAGAGLAVTIVALALFFNWRSGTDESGIDKKD